jgi:murein DD-endopeptidase MepM/ murein hydrolase activator NlpD
MIRSFFVILAAFALVSAATVASAQSPSLGGGRAPVPASGINCIPADPTLGPSAEAHRPPVEGAGLILYADPMGNGGTNSFGQTIVNYVDLSPTASILDWSCGSTSYDGHGGWDIEIPSFYHMDEMTTPVLAAAPGTVSQTRDGEFDRRTSWQSGVNANYAIVTHADGSQAWYWHFKNGSVRVSPGQPVAAGDTLGFIGSSGFSSGPHLHFETRDPGVVEPSNGSCNGASSRWISQAPYVWNLPFQLFGHGLTTLPITWPTLLEWPPSQTHVTAGSTIYSWIRPRNLTTANLMTLRLYANGALWGTYNWSASGNYSSSWWYITWTLPVTPSLYGNWRADVVRDGVVIAQDFFTYDAAPNQPPVMARNNFVLPTNSSLTADFPSSDPDGAVFWNEITIPPTHGTIQLLGGRKRKFKYTPPPGFVGIDSVYARAQDNQNLFGAPVRLKFAVGLPLDVPTADAGPRIALSRPSPNPVSSRAEFQYTLPRAAAVRLEVLDVTGQRVAVVESGQRPAGDSQVSWTPRRDDGSELSAGVYFLTLVADAERVTRRIVVAR